MSLIIKSSITLQFFSFLKNIQNYDKVIVCDFGHGMFNKSIVKILEKNQNFYVLTFKLIQEIEVIIYIKNLIRQIYWFLTSQK